MAQARSRAADADQAARTSSSDTAQARRELERATARRERQRAKVEDFAARLDQARVDERDLATAERAARKRVEATDREARRAGGRARDAHAYLDQVEHAA